MSQLTDDVETGNAILFVGAGFSLEGESLLNRKFMTGNNLRDYLLGLCGVSLGDDYDLESAAEEFIEHFDQARLIDLLHKNFSSKSISDAQRIIICQPWYRIYTTNYDDIIERCCSEGNKSYTSKTISDKVEPPSVGTTQLLHIYGTASRLSPSEFTNHFLLTETQRDNSPFLNSNWFSRFGDDILSCKSLVFIGFSLNDIDIRRLLRFLPDALKVKVKFYDHPFSSRATQRRLKGFGQLCLTGVDGLAADLMTLRLGPATRPTLSPPRHVKELQIEPKSSVAVSGTDIQYLLAFGIIDEMKLAKSDIDGAPGSYTFSRQPQSYVRARSAFDNGQILLVHSDIGNGKTVFLYQLAYLFTSQGGRSFVIHREPENVGEIISFIQNLTGDVLLIFDDLMSFNSLIRRLRELGNKQIKIAVAVRTALLETASGAVSARIGNVVPVQIDLNIAYAQEAKRIVSYLDENAVFGSLASMTESERQDFVLTACGGQVRDVLLSLFEHGALHDRLIQLLSGLNELSDECRRVAVLGALITIGGVRQFGGLPIVAELLSLSGSYEELRSDYAKRQLIGLFQIDSSDIALRSSALATFVLKTVFDLSEIISVAEGALKAIDRIFYDEKDFERLSRALLKFSLYGKFIKTKQHDIDLESFYDRCRVLRIAKKDPLFLVQRSINSMHYNRFDASHRYVQTALARANHLPGFDNYQIETHLAKLILTQAWKEGPTSGLVEETRAQDLLEGVLRRKADDLYHPLSVMRLYSDIVEARSDDLSSEDKTLLRRLVLRAVARLAAFPKDARDRFPNLPYIQRKLEGAANRLIAA